MPLVEFYQRHIDLYGDISESEHEIISTGELSYEEYNWKINVFILYINMKVSETHLLIVVISLLLGVGAGVMRYVYVQRMDL